MIHTVAQKAANTGFAIDEPLRDDTGAYTYRMTYEEDPFYLVVKEYAFKGLASFMESVVLRAEAEGAYLLFYQSDSDKSYVFDAEYVEQFGKLSTGKSKTKDTRWRELPLDAGCRLGDFLAGTDTPRTLAGDNATLAEF